MKLVISIVTACVLVAIIVPLTIKEEKQGISLFLSWYFCVSKFKCKFDLMIISYYMMKIKSFKCNHTNAKEVTAHRSTETPSMVLVYYVALSQKASNRVNNCFVITNIIFKLRFTQKSYQNSQHLAHFSVQTAHMFVLQNLILMPELDYWTILLVNMMSWEITFKRLKKKKKAKELK